MTVASAQITVSTTAVRLSPLTDAGYAAGSGVIVRNKGAVSVWLGGPGVNNTNGFELAPGDTFSADLEASDKLYGRTGSGSALCHVNQVGI